MEWVFILLKKGGEMEVSHDKTGLVLIEEMAMLTGLPLEWVKPELTKLAEKAGLNLSNLTLDELRPVLLQFLGEMVLEADESEAMALSH
jgi:hypothetical protein